MANVKVLLRENVQDLGTLGDIIDYVQEATRRAGPAESGWVSGSSPLAMLMGR